MFDTDSYNHNPQQWDQGKLPINNVFLFFPTPLCQLASIYGATARSDHAITLLETFFSFFSTITQQHGCNSEFNSASALPRYVQKVKIKSKTFLPEVRD